MPSMQISTWLERAIVGCLFIVAIFAPHSIAVTQAAWLLGMALWVARLAIYPRPPFFRSPVDYALIGFFILSGISSIFSYSPIISIGKMRAASLFTIVYLISQNVALAAFGAIARVDVDRIVHDQCVVNCGTTGDR